MRPSVDAHTGSYDLAKHMLTVQATSTSASASLNALVTSSGQLIGTLTNAGGGKYQGQFSLATTPQNVTVKSSLGGSASPAVTPKVARLGGPGFWVPLPLRPAAPERASASGRGAARPCVPSCLSTWRAVIQRPAASRVRSGPPAACPMPRSTGESAPPVPGVQKSAGFKRHAAAQNPAGGPASDDQATHREEGWMEPGEGTARGHVQDTGAEPAPPTAVLRFRHSPGGSGVSRTGHLRPGGRLVVEYDPARLPPSADTPGTSWDIICHVRFRPGGQHYSGSVLDKREGLAQAATPRHAPFEMRIPTDAGEVELWFESRGPTGTSGWDSRYGQNYSFVVIGEGLPVPEPSVAPRADAIEDPDQIRVLEDAAAKEQTRMGTAGRRLHSTLGVHALVADPTGLADAWADIHVFDAAGELIHAGSVTLQRRESRADGTLFVLENDVYQGSGGGSGIGAWSRPDAHTIQYRLYYQPQQPGFDTPRQVFTDGVLHEFELPADEEVGGPR